MKRNIVRLFAITIACLGLIHCSHSEEAVPAEELETTTAAEEAPTDVTTDDAPVEEVVDSTSQEIDDAAQDAEDMPEGLTWWERLEYRISKAGQENSEEAEKRVRGQLESWGFINAKTDEAIVDEETIEAPAEEPTH